MKQQHHSLPSLPGVYLFKNRIGEIIYVGKAKDLHKRVATYFQKSRDWKIDALMHEYDHYEHVVVHSETEAFLLEAQLIAQHKPRFNVLLKTGQPFVYLLLTKESLPKLHLVRNKKMKGTYFGPFLHKRQARNAYAYLSKTFRLSWCTSSIEGGCLNYHLGNCAGNCTSSFDERDYLFRVQLACDVLRGNYNTSLQNLKKQIALYNKELAFEKAKNIAIYLKNLEVIFETLKAKFSEKKYQKEIDFALSPLHKRTELDLTVGRAIKELLLLEHAPSTLDCFDISHFQSSFLTGSCVRFTNGIPDKNKFRRFRIKTLIKQNDYAALQEIVTRRYKDGADLPDLILIDGGKGQLGAIKEVLPDANIISLAKREERVFATHLPEGVTLDLSTDAGRLLIGLRDYTHHFAVSYHKLLRSKKLLRT